jgi:hypothetical protein
MASPFPAQPSIGGDARRFEAHSDPQRSLGDEADQPWRQQGEADQDDQQPPRKLLAPPTGEFNDIAVFGVPG